jgi:ribulose-phosphate 3-epimerase
MKILVTPSILSADLVHLQDEVDSVASAADWLQVDVMDGHFVPNLSLGAPVIKNLKTSLPLDIHLMVTNPADRIAEFQAIAGVAHITFHAEAVPETSARKSLLEAIRKGGQTAGIALNPDTSLDVIADVINDIDLLLIMSVHPGFGGQAFIESVLEKVKMARAAYPDLMIQIDGGINAQTALLARGAGANNLVAGQAIFGSSDRITSISSIRGV